MSTESKNPHQEQAATPAATPKDTLEGSSAETTKNEEQASIIESQSGTTPSQSSPIFDPPADGSVNIAGLMRKSPPSEALLGDNRTRANWLVEEIEGSIHYIGNKRTFFQQIASAMRISTFILAGAVTILLGLDYPAIEQQLKNIAFVLGAAVTILTSIDSYFNLRALWVEHEEAKWHFHRLRDRLNFYLTGLGDHEPDPNIIAEFHETYQDIWNTLSSRWISHRKNSSSRN